MAPSVFGFSRSRFSTSSCSSLRMSLLQDSTCTAEDLCSCWGLVCHNGKLLAHADVYLCSRALQQTPFSGASQPASKPGSHCKRWSLCGRACSACCSTDVSRGQAPRLNPTTVHSNRMACIGVNARVLRAPHLFHDRLGQGAQDVFAAVAQRFHRRLGQPREGLEDRPRSVAVVVAGCLARHRRTVLRRGRRPPSCTGSRQVSGRRDCRRHRTA